MSRIWEWSTSRSPQQQGSLLCINDRRKQTGSRGKVDVGNSSLTGQHLFVVRSRRNSAPLRSNSIRVSSPSTAASAAVAAPALAASRRRSAPRSRVIVWRPRAAAPVRYRRGDALAARHSAHEVVARRGVGPRVVYTRREGDAVEGRPAGRAADAWRNVRAGGVLGVLGGRSRLLSWVGVVGGVRVVGWKRFRLEDLLGSVWWRAIISRRRMAVVAVGQRTRRPPVAMTEATWSRAAEVWTHGAAAEVSSPDKASSSSSSSPWIERRSVTASFAHQRWIQQGLRRSVLGRTAGGFLLLPYPLNDAFQVDLVVVREFQAETPSCVRFDFLAVAPDLDRPVLVEGVVDVDGLGERQLAPAQPVEMENAAQGARAQAWGEHPIDWRHVVPHFRAETGEALESAAFAHREHKDYISGFVERTVNFRFVAGGCGPDAFCFGQGNVFKVIALYDVKVRLAQQVLQHFCVTLSSFGAHFQWRQYDFLLGNGNVWFARRSDVVVVFVEVVLARAVVAIKNNRRDRAVPFGRLPWFVFVFRIGDVLVDVPAVGARLAPRVELLVGDLTLVTLRVQLQFVGRLLVASFLVVLAVRTFGPFFFGVVFFREFAVDFRFNIVVADLAVRLERGCSSVVISEVSVTCTKYVSQYTKLNVTTIDKKCNFSKCVALFLRKQELLKKILTEALRPHQQNIWNQSHTRVLTSSTHKNEQ